MKKSLIWIALVVLGGIYPALWTSLFWGPALFPDESERLRYGVTWGDIAFELVIWSIPLLIVTGFVWYVVRDARKFVRVNPVEDPRSRE